MDVPTRSTPTFGGRIPPNRVGRFDSEGRLTQGITSRDPTSRQDRSNLAH